MVTPASTVRTPCVPVLAEESTPPSTPTAVRPEME